MAGAGGSNNALHWFRGLGLTAQITPDGDRFTLGGLAALDPTVREAVSRRAREQRSRIVETLREEAARDARLEANPPELWPLVCYYTTISSIGHVLNQHRLELEIVGKDFRLKKSCPAAWEKLPKLLFFFRHNGDLINEWLRGAHGTE